MPYYYLKKNTKPNEDIFFVYFNVIPYFFGKVYNIFLFILSYFLSSDLCKTFPPVYLNDVATTHQSNKGDFAGFVVFSYNECIVKLSCVADVNG